MTHMVTRGAIYSYNVWASFCKVMSEVTRQRAEHLRQEVKQLLVQGAGQAHTGVTLSIGVAIYPEHGRTIEAVLRPDNTALYRAKQEGRDRGIPVEKQE